MENKKKACNIRQVAALSQSNYSTTRRIIKKNGYKYQKFKKLTKLNEEIKIKRLKFVEEMKNTPSDWYYTCIKDECSFWLNRCHPEKVWGKEAMEIESKGNHGPKVHWWGGITSRSALKIKIFEGNLESTKYCKTMKKKQMELEELYPEGYIWQQDGSGVHRSDISKDFVNENFPMIMKFPPYSPDLSLIENIWGWLKR